MMQFPEPIEYKFRLLFENCTEEQSSFLGNALETNIYTHVLDYISIGRGVRVIKKRYLSA